MVVAVDHSHGVVVEQGLHVNIVLIHVYKPGLWSAAFSLQVWKVTQDALKLFDSVVYSLVFNGFSIIYKTLKQMFVADHHRNELLTKVFVLELASIEVEEKRAANCELGSAHAEQRLQLVHDHLLRLLVADTYQHLDVSLVDCAKLQDFCAAAVKCLHEDCWDHTANEVLNLDVVAWCARSFKWLHFAVADRACECKTA